LGFESNIPEAGSEEVLRARHDRRSGSDQRQGSRHSKARGLLSVEAQVLKVSSNDHNRVGRLASPPCASRSSWDRTHKSCRLCGNSSAQPIHVDSLGMFACCPSWALCLQKRFADISAREHTKAGLNDVSQFGVLNFRVRAALFRIWTRVGHAPLTDVRGCYKGWVLW
jgi:hypothetical protein